MTEANELAAAWQDVATREYIFTEENPYREGKDTFAEGMRLFNEGDIDNAILAFQAFVQRTRKIVVKAGGCWVYRIKSTTRIGKPLMFGTSS